MYPSIRHNVTKHLTDHTTTEARVPHAPGNQKRRTLSPAPFAYCRGLEPNLQGLRGRPVNHVDLRLWCPRCVCRHLRKLHLRKLRHGDLRRTQPCIRTYATGTSAVHTRVYAPTPRGPPPYIPVYRHLHHGDLHRMYLCIRTYTTGIHTYTTGTSAVYTCVYTHGIYTSTPMVLLDVYLHPIHLD